MSSCFAEFHPNLVVGGTYSGQIVLWDNRVNKRTPIQRTPLSAAAHTVSYSIQLREIVLPLLAAAHLVSYYVQSGGIVLPLSVTAHTISYTQCPVLGNSFTPLCCHPYCKLHVVSSLGE